MDLSTGALVDGEGFEDQFSSIEIVTGSTFDDTLLGGSGDDTLIGGDGSDVLVGGPDDGLPGTDADVAVFEGLKGSYEFGVDAVSGSLTVTSKDTGSVDILEGIETLSFGDGPLTVSQTPDAAFFESQLALPSGLQVGDRVEFALTGVEGLDDGVSISIDLSSDADIASLSETLRSIISTSIADSSLEVVSNQEDLGSGITLRSSEAFDVSLSRVSHVIEDIFSSIVVASLGEDVTTSEFDAETQVSDEIAVIATEAPPLDEEFGASTESADAVVVSADVHELRFEVPSDFTGIDVVTVNVSAGGENLSVGLGMADVLSGLGEDDTASSLFANAFVSAFESEFPEALDISSEVVTDIEGGSSTVVLSATSGPIILSVLAESREEQLVTEGVEVSAYTLTGSDGADDVIEVQSEIGFVLEERQVLTR